MKEFLVVITGASGSVYAMRLLEQLLSGGHAVTLIVTDAGRKVMAHELGFALPDEGPATAVLRYLELPVESMLRVAWASDIFDRVASGSHKVDAMFVIPASMGFLGEMASGTAADLPARAADVMLKERRPVILVPRETPLSLIHLRNMTTLAEAGAVVLPAMPAFYAKPRSLDDMVNFVVGKVLDSAGLDHELFPRWGE